MSMITLKVMRMLVMMNLMERLCTHQSVAGRSRVSQSVGYVVGEDITAE
jgi:hypothetical protein